MSKHVADPDCPKCGHKIRLHSYRWGCTRCECGRPQDPPRPFIEPEQVDP